MLISNTFKNLVFFKKLSTINISLLNLLRIETANSVSKLINFDVLYELLFKPLKKKRQNLRLHIKFFHVLHKPKREHVGCTVGYFSSPQYIFPNTVLSTLDICLPQNSSAENDS
jgi:hypothetical protein